jgi:hypothetical protein
MTVWVGLIVASEAFVAKRLGTHKRRMKFGRKGVGTSSLKDQAKVDMPGDKDHMQSAPSLGGNHYSGFTEELYLQDWVIKAQEHSEKVTEPERWAMFNDDGKIRTRPEEITDACNMKGINGRVHTFPPAFKHIPIQKERQPGAQKVRAFAHLLSPGPFHPPRRRRHFPCRSSAGYSPMQGFTRRVPKQYASLGVGGATACFFSATLLTQNCQV